ncbi:hypothetical protein DUZ99_15415 [Xylanibacillus composti]|uniref:Uncharacterized protein n=1 Tax=Xylanibacillus composti TaxID=1572762 RepID=A0A8J4H664_9BACL|nr:hypothetical protein [Xylanibacillus composti]MDT9726371.1 hypothetical protein [Xylanibacillus composti]GIQ70390.1 hypothetical protein XYCOK13_32140 [Xylanibacillus composti]
MYKYEQSSRQDWYVQINAYVTDRIRGCRIPLHAESVGSGLADRQQARRGKGYAFSSGFGVHII